LEAKGNKPETSLFFSQAMVFSPDTEADSPGSWRLAECIQENAPVHWQVCYGIRMTGLHFRDRGVYLDG
jgi:hypothetical protein